MFTSKQPQPNICIYNLHNADWERWLEETVSNFCHKSINNKQRDVENVRV